MSEPLPSGPARLGRCRYQHRRWGKRPGPSVALFSWETDPPVPVCLPCLIGIFRALRAFGGGEFGLDVVEEHADAVAAVALEFQLVAATVDEQKLLTRLDQVDEQRSPSSARSTSSPTSPKRANLANGRI